MSDNEDFDRRLTAVEVGVAAVRSEAATARTDAAAARTLASAAHADVAEVKTALNAHFRVLNALRETQVDHGQRLDRLEARFDVLEAKVDQGFAQADRNFAEVERQFSAVNVGIAQITAMLTNLTDPGSPAGQN